MSNASIEQINTIIYSVTNSLLYQLKGKIHYECPCLQFKFLKLVGKSTCSLTSNMGAGFFFYDSATEYTYIL